MLKHNLPGCAEGVSCSQGIVALSVYKTSSISIAQAGASATPTAAPSVTSVFGDLRHC
jgi:hypothetical protein